MKRNRSLGMMGTALLVVIITVLGIGPGAWAQSQYEVLYTFSGGSDGVYPNGALVFDRHGNLYGTTYEGGGGACSGPGQNGCGTVFELTCDRNGRWQHSVIYSFQNGNDGAGPNGSLVWDTAGNLYGTTYYGGSYGSGTAFELSPNSDGTWTESVIYTFTGGSDGFLPMAGLTMDSTGNLYGTTWGGGNGAGVVFELTKGSNGWAESVLYAFCPGNDCGGGLSSWAGLTLDPFGELYGTTEFGGSGPYGTVFKLKPTSGTWKESVLHSFTGGTSDGGNPGEAGVIFDRNWNLYGTTGQQGMFGYGTVYKLARGCWKETVLHNFDSGSSEGSLNSGLTIDAAGNLYGANGTGGKGPCDYGSGCGMVYELTPGAHEKWTYSVVHEFSGGPDGGIPSGDLILDKKGNLYGAVGVGGAAGSGVIFEILRPAATSN